MPRKKEGELNTIWQDQWDWDGFPLKVDLGKLEEEILSRALGKASTMSWEEEQYRDLIKEAVIALKAEHEADRFEISAPVFITKGEANIIAVSNKRIISATFGKDLTNSDVDFYTKIYIDKEGDNPPKEFEARIVTSKKIDPGIRDRVLISQGLANRMGIGTSGRIVISKIYQKVEDIDLDTLIAKNSDDDDKDE